MAKSDKGESKTAQEPEIVEDIVEAVEDTVQEDEAKPEDELPEGDTASEDEAVEAELESSESDPIEEPQPEPQREQVVERKGGFVPMLLGGVLAAGVGVVSAQYIFPDGLPFGASRSNQIDVQSELTLLSGRLDDQTARLDGMPQVDAAAIEAAIASLGDVQAQIGAIADRTASLEARLEALEARPAGDGSGVSAKMERELNELRAALDAQKGELAQMLDAAQAKEASAEETARQALARAAITRILVALDSGAPFEDALAQVQANSDAALPDALVQTAAEGVPTLARLSESYPEAARAALAAAREDNDGGGVGGFLAKQLGVRSVAPREGDDPDAVLSRVGAAVNDGRIADALAEAEALPEAAKSALASWSDQANLRLTAAQEAEALANSLNSQ